MDILDKKLLVAFIAIIAVFAAAEIYRSYLAPGTGGPPADGNGKQEFLVTSVTDGDTLALDTGDKVRLMGINAEETGRPHASAATGKLKEMVLGQKVELLKDGDADKDYYGRLLRYVFVNGTHVNMELVRQGYVHVWLFEGNDLFRAEFFQAEQEAREAGLGIWERPPMDFNVTIADLHYVQESGSYGLNQEYILIRNQGNASVNLDSWVVKDQSTTIFTFPKLELDPGDEARLHSGKGSHDGLDLYWGLSYGIWNNGGDAAFLRDSAGYLVDFYAYGTR